MAYKNILMLSDVKHWLRVEERKGINEGRVLIQGAAKTRSNQK